MASDFKKFEEVSLAEGKVVAPLQKVSQHIHYHKDGSVWAKGNMIDGALDGYWECPVVHFEMPAKDKKRVKKFYETAFGWGMKQLGSNMGDYILATTTPVDKKGMAKNPGAINGGFFQSGEYGTVPHLVISVDDLKKHMQIVKKAGGKILGKQMDIPGVGKFIMTADSEGNRVGMLQPVM